MSKLFTDVWKETLQNLSGKTVEGNFQELAELLTAFNDLYLCKVTFSTTPSGATIVVKDSGGNAIPKHTDGTYHLKEGTYTYTVSADHYTTKSNQSLTITNSDETTGTKTVNVSLDRADCEVTFTLSPETATLVVKDSESHTVSPVGGKYYLAAGSYTYTASAEGYTPKENQSLTISAGDVTTGTKTVSVTLVEA